MINARALLVVLLAALQLPAIAGSDEPSPIRIAVEHLRAEAARYGVAADDVAELTVTDAYRSAHNGVTHVYLRQRLDGREVLGTSATVNVMPDGSILHVAAQLRPDLRATAAGDLRLDPIAALLAAAAHLGFSVSAPTRLVAGTGDRVLIDGQGFARAPVSAFVAYQRTTDERVRLAWNLEIDEVARDHWWNASIDAETGELLSARDYITHDDAEIVAAAVARPDGSVTTAERDGRGGGVADGSSYRVFALPLESPNDGPRTLEVEPADPASSPYGWHDVNGHPGPEFTTTRGNNVHAYADWTATGLSLPGFDAEGGTSLTFDHELDLALPPQSYRDASITNLFYWNNITHDVLARYGFDEAAGNFQWTNYSGQGRGGDFVIAQGQDHGGRNNANFATPPDGQSGRMQMYLWVNTNRRIRDGSLDAGIVIHEYGHGISLRLSGGPSNTDCLNGAEQGGEGWSDFFAIALTARQGDTGTQPRGLATYSVGDQDRHGSGLRPYRYSTHQGFNPATYNNIKTEAVPHGVGWVWATMLWEVYWALADAHGFNPDVYGAWNTGGNNLAIQLVVDGLKMQGCNAGFVDARNAILAADVALTGGANQCRLWVAFAKRGLGQHADQGSYESRSDGTQSFTVPGACSA